MPVPVATRMKVKEKKCLGSNISGSIVKGKNKINRAQSLQEFRPGLKSVLERKPRQAFSGAENPLEAVAFAAIKCQPSRTGSESKAHC